MTLPCTSENADPTATVRVAQFQRENISVYHPGHRTGLEDSSVLKS